MVVLGIDAHKRTHTIVAIDERGRQIAHRTINATTADQLALVTWAQALGEERLWAVEDCRHLSRRLERDLLGAGERIVRVPTKMMAAARKTSTGLRQIRPIDALAVARAALQEPDLPAAHLDGLAREVRLLVDHREDLVAERTRIINRLRWHLHELDPTWDPPVRSFDRNKTIIQMTANLAERDGTVARLARRLLVSLHRSHRRDQSPRRRDRRTGRRDRPYIARDLRGRHARRSQDRRGDRRRPSVQVERRLRPLQRHRPPTGLVIEPSPPSPQPGREPPAQLCHPPMALTQAHWQPDARAYSNAAKHAGDTPKRPYEPSSAASPTSSTEPSSPTPPGHSTEPNRESSEKPLDIGASYTPPRPRRRRLHQLPILGQRKT